MNAYPLTQEQIDYYRENGFVKLENMLTDEELESLRSAANDILSDTVPLPPDAPESAKEYRRVFDQRVNLWPHHSGIKQHVFNAKIAAVARQLAGHSATRLWHDHLLTKMPGDSKASAWHQDLPYWPFFSNDTLSCWMALDDVTVANGCMQFVPKSQSWGLFEPINLITPQALFDLVPDKKAEDFEPIVAEMKAGSCTFHNGMTFHYAGPNQTEKPRRAMVTIYIPDGVIYEGRSHPVTDPLSMQTGQQMAGDMFPILSP